MGAYYGMNRLCLSLGANDKAASAALFREVGHWPQSFEYMVRSIHCCAPLQTHQASAALQVPQIAFQRSGDAFFACFALHVLNIGFENTDTKRQVSQKVAGSMSCFTSTGRCSRLQPTAASVQTLQATKGACPYAIRSVLPLRWHSVLACDTPRYLCSWRCWLL